MSSNRKPTPRAIVWHVSPVRKTAFGSAQHARKSRSSACVKSCTSSTYTSSILGPGYPTSRITAKIAAAASITSYAPYAAFQASYRRKYSHTSARPPSAASSPSERSNVGAIFRPSARYSSRDSRPPAASSAADEPLMNETISRKTTDGLSAHFRTACCSAGPAAASRSSLGPRPANAASGFSFATINGHR